MASPTTIRPQGVLHALLELVEERVALDFFFSGQDKIDSVQPGWVMGPKFS